MRANIYCEETVSTFGHKLRDLMSTIKQDRPPFFFFLHGTPAVTHALFQHVLPRFISSNKDTDTDMPFLEVPAVYSLCQHLVSNTFSK